MYVYSYVYTNIQTVIVLEGCSVAEETYKRQAYGMRVTLSNPLGKQVQFAAKSQVWWVCVRV